MAINFPDSPSLNDTHTVNGRTWVWDGTAWKLSGTVNNGINLEISDTAPATPIEGDLWYNSANGSTYTYYQSVWVELGNTAAVEAFIADADGDTYVHVEDNTDEDIIRLYTGGTERVNVSASAIAPASNEQYDLGTSSNRFRDLYLSGTSIDLGGMVISTDGTSLSMTPTGGAPADPVATESYVDTAITDLVGGAPLALDTLNELAAALNDDASYATTITNALALKLDSSTYTAADVLAKLITVDGAGSSLDADTLDGSHASAFAASSHTHSYAATSHTHSYLPLTGGTVTGQVNISNGNSSGNLYGPNSSWGAYLFVGSGTDRANSNTAAILSTDGNLHIDVADSKTMYLNYYTQGRPIWMYGDLNMNGYSISLGSGSSAKSFASGSNYWRPQDAYGNSYFDIQSGQFYVDSDIYYFRNRASTNSLVIDSAGNGTFAGRMTSDEVYTQYAEVSQTGAGPQLIVSKNGSAPGNAVAFFAKNQYANHSWGVVGEFRIDGISGSDKPAILFSSGQTSTTWTVGFDQTSDTFGIRKNRGWRNGGWGESVFRILNSNVIQMGTMEGTYAYFSDNVETSGYVNSIGQLRSVGVYNAATPATNDLIHCATSAYQYRFFRSTSVRASKKDIEPLDDAHADLLLQAQPVWYRSAMPQDDDRLSYYGFIAEDMAELDPRFANWGVSDDCQCTEEQLATYEHTFDHPPECIVPTGIPYERLTAHLTNLVQRQHARIESLESRIEALEAN